MLQPESILKVADNTGAQAVKVITVLGSLKIAKLGDVVTGSVQGVFSSNSIVSDHEVVRAVIVRAKKEQARDDGSYIRFDDNACAVIDKKGQPRGTRIFGPVAREVRRAGFTELAAMAPEVI